MIQRLLSKETMERFLTDFKNKLDYKLQFSSRDTALIMDAINAWEHYRQDQFALTFYDRSRVFMALQTVSTSNAA